MCPKSVTKELNLNIQIFQKSRSHTTNQLVERNWKVASYAAPLLILTFRNVFGTCSVPFQTHIKVKVHRAAALWKDTVRELLPCLELWSPVWPRRPPEMHNLRPQSELCNIGMLVVAKYSEICTSWSFIIFIHVNELTIIWLFRVR